MAGSTVSLVGFTDDKESRPRERLQAGIYSSDDQGVFGNLTNDIHETPVQTHCQ